MTLYKWLIVGVGLLLLTSLAACTQKVPERQTVERNGILYKMGADKPFSGIVTGRGREDYRRAAYNFKKEYKKGILDGETVFLFSNGKIESKVPYKNGVVSGFMMRYWPNGRPKARIHFMNGLRGGAKGEMFWDEDGHQISS